jgi:hypothetical protein
VVLIATGSEVELALLPPQRWPRKASPPRGVDAVDRCI